MLTTNNEEKRSKIWELATSVSTVLIIIIVLYFLTRMFTGNPLEGTWLYEDSDLVLTVGDEGKAIVEWTENMDDSKVQVELEYSIDKELKTFTLSAEEAEIQKAVAEFGDAVTEEAVRSNVSVLSATYEYNVENHQLTLTDREYGDQMIFDKK